MLRCSRVQLGGGADGRVIRVRKEEQPPSEHSRSAVLFVACCGHFKERSPVALLKDAFQRVLQIARCQQTLPLRLRSAGLRLNERSLWHRPHSSVLVALLDGYRESHTARRHFVWGRLLHLEKSYLGTYLSERDPLYR